MAAFSAARGARDYGTALPRLGLDRKPIAIPSEPSGCAKCLSERYLAHYFKMGCTPKTGELVCSKPCWKYFECPELEETVEGWSLFTLIHKMMSLFAISRLQIQW